MLFRSDFVTNSLSEFFNSTKNACGLLTANILKKENIDAAKFSSYTWYHFDKLLNFSKDTKSYIIAKPYLFCVRPKKNNWFSAKNFLLYSVEIITAIMKSSADKKTKDLLLNLYKATFYKNIFRAKRHCKKGVVDYNDLEKQVIEARKHYDYDFDFEQKMLKSKYRWWFMARLKKYLKA